MLARYRLQIKVELTIIAAKLQKISHIRTRTYNVMKHKRVRRMLRIGANG